VVATATTAMICSLFAPTVSDASAMLVCTKCAPWSVSRPCPGCGGEEVIRLHVDVARSFRLAHDRGRDLPVADSGGLPTSGTDFDLTGSYGDYGCD
jgi:hypothetical protein